MRGLNAARAVGRRVLAVAGALLALSMAGCLEAKKYSDVAYEKGTDTFRFLRVYYHIAGQNADELKYLGALNANRDHLIPGDLIAFLGESAYLPLDAKTFLTISLGEAGEKPKDVGNSPVDLTMIVNKPGKFFVTGEKTLGYYHQFELPGKVVDGLLASVSKEGNKGLLEVVKKEMGRRKGGGEVADYAVLRNRIKSMLGLEADAAVTAAEMEKAPANPLEYVDSDTLALLEAAATDEKMGVSREGATFTLTLVASKGDRAKVLELFETLKREILAKAEKADAGKDLAAAKELLPLIKMASGGEKSDVLTVSVDFVALRAAAEKAGVLKLDEKFDGGADAKYGDAVTYAKAHGLEVDETVKLEEISAAFVKGTLAVGLPKMSVTAGEGLFTTTTTAPATTEGRRSEGAFPVSRCQFPELNWAGWELDGAGLG